MGSRLSFFALAHSCCLFLSSAKAYYYISPRLQMDWIPFQDWVDRVTSCFYKERDKDTPEMNNNDITDLIAEFSDEGKIQ